MRYMVVRFISAMMVLGFASAGATGAYAAPKLPAGNSKAPIEINADALEVQQDKNIAVFSGHVVAIQDNIRLKSDKMTVYYRSPEGENKSGQQDAIRKIEV